ncbi:MAG TPA: MOSC domain-containing protein, partial [Blastocatellia bacterium]|nr:MOSC domain-containing protein [Blastocatellia bacterium]
MIDATLLSIQVGMPQSLGSPKADDPINKPWVSGIYKNPIEGRVWLGKTNLAGDGQADLRVHGGPDKAVNVYPSEHYPHWLKELKIESAPFGSFGENFTTWGLSEESVCIG